jgi:hypothetical protein
MQAAYRVLVASTLELGREGKADVWDSGRIRSSDPWALYAGPTLRTRTRYYWSVRVWATNRLASEWAQPTWFETALISASVWQGRWIAGPERAGPLPEAAGKADDEAIRAAGEFCRPTAWLTSGFAAAGQEQPGRVPRAAPGTDAAQVVPGHEARRAPGAASGLAYNQLTLNGTPASTARSTPGSRTTARPCYTPRTTSRHSSGWA